MPLWVLRLRILGAEPGSRRIFVAAAIGLLLADHPLLFRQSPKRVDGQKGIEKKIAVESEIGKRGEEGKETLQCYRLRFLESLGQAHAVWELAITDGYPEEQNVTINLLLPVDYLFTSINEYQIPHLAS